MKKSTVVTLAKICPFCFIIFFLTLDQMWPQLSFATFKDFWPPFFFNSPLMPQTALISVFNKGKFDPLACGCPSHAQPPSAPFLPLAMPQVRGFHAAEVGGW